MKSHPPSEVSFLKEEWDFSSIHPEFADVCLRYELAREMISPSKYFQASDTTTARVFALKPFDSHPELKACLKGTAGDRWNNAYYRVQLNAMDRTQLPAREMLNYIYFMHPDGTARAFPPDLEAVPWLALEPAWQLVLGIIYHQLIAAFSSYSPESIAETQQRDPGVLDRMRKPGPRQFFDTIVDWTQSDTAIVESFKTWLIMKRPPAFRSHQGSVRQSASDDLKAVGAMRLRHFLRHSEAAALTQKVLGKPLYSDSFAWDRAADRARNLFAKYYPHAGKPKSHVSVSNPRGRPPKIPHLQ